MLLGVLCRSRLGRGAGFLGGATDLLALALLFLLAGVLLLLLFGLPLLADFFEFFGGAFCAMRLHSNMGIQVVQRAICLFTAIPSALIHALNLLISTTWTLVLLCTWNGYK